MDVILIHHPSEIPHFASEEEEAAYWDSHGFAEDFPFLTGPAPGRTAELLRRYRKQHAAASAERDARG